jgi:hypothetical protein
MCRIIFSILLGLTILYRINAQESGAMAVINDSLSSEEITFTPTSASIYIINSLDMSYLWKPESEDIKIPLNRLIEQYNERYDSIVTKLTNLNYRPESFKKVNFSRNDSLPVRWLNDSTFIIDTLKLGKDPLFVQKTVVKRILDSLVFFDERNIAAGYAGNSITRITDTIIREKDIVFELIIDTALLESNKLQLYQIKNRKIVPEIISTGRKKHYRFLADGSKIILSEPVQVLVADQNSPFNIVPNEKMPDSLRVAVQTLLSYIDKRDSLPIYLNNIEGVSTPFWLTVGEDELHRYWVKNQKNDSVSIWMGNPDKSNLTLILEDDINVDRTEKENLDDVPFTITTPLFKLAKIEPLKEIPVFWDYEFLSSFSLSENFISNWANGGETSISSLLDVKGQAKYTNKEANIEWTGNVRLKYGSNVSEEYGLRTNTDMLELDSKYNKELRKKTDFSALFHMKNQIAKGYNYPNDSIPISKFLNPTTFTIGVGVEYKPLKKTSINFSVLSYKNTFVLDTVNIDQTIHGIEKNKRAKQEMGGQILINNELRLFDDMKINNSLRLFSNYLNTPGNIDVEWEIDLEKQLSLYFTILLNIHMIYDDDIRFPKLDENGDSILLADGSEKKIPKLQFKQFLGLTFLIKL